MKRLALPLLLLLLLPVPACNARDEAALPSGRVVLAGQAVEVEVAQSEAARARGLSGRAELAPGRGMLFLHERPGLHAYWMKDMRFAIDILWLREGRVVDVAHRVQPEPPGTADRDLPSYAPRAPADAVLEVPAGFARAHGWDVGQQASFELPAP
jgi:uncharacterized membrane protein (UPF0127 family)